MYSVNYLWLVVSTNISGSHYRYTYVQHISLVTAHHSSMATLYENAYILKWSVQSVHRCRWPPLFLLLFISMTITLMWKKLSFHIYNLYLYNRIFHFWHLESSWVTWTSVHSKEVTSYIFLKYLNDSLMVQLSCKITLRSHKNVGEMWKTVSGMCGWNAKKWNRTHPLTMC